MKAATRRQDQAHTRTESHAVVQSVLFFLPDYACDELGPKVTRTLALITQWRQEVPDTKIIVYGTHKATLRKLAYALALHLDPRYALSGGSGL